MSPRRRLDCQDHLSHQVHGDKLAAGLAGAWASLPASAGEWASLSASGRLSVAERQAFGASCDQLQLGVAVAPSDGRVARYSVFERLSRTNRRRPRECASTFCRSDRGVRSSKQALKRPASPLTVVVRARPAQIVSYFYSALYQAGPEIV